jgi:hypothetical protein
MTPLLTAAIFATLLSVSVQSKGTVRWSKRYEVSADGLVAEERTEVTETDRLVRLETMDKDRLSHNAGDGLVRVGAHAGDDGHLLQELCTLDSVHQGCSALAMRVELYGVTAADLADYFAAPMEDIVSFIDAIGLEYPALFHAIPCDTLCFKSLEYAKTNKGYVIPAEHGKACVNWRKGRCAKWKDLRAVEIERVAASLNETDLEEPLSIRGRDSFEEPMSMDESDVIKVRINAGHQEVLRYTVEELVLRIANNFDIFPSAAGTGTARGWGNDGAAGLLHTADVPTFGNYVDSKRFNELTEIWIEAQSWVRNAVNKLPVNPTIANVWFGDTSPANIQKVRKILQGMVQTLEKTHVKKGSHEVCKEKVMAYVMATHDNGEFQSSERTDSSPPKYVINVCPYFWQQGLLSRSLIKYGFAVHEAAHHHGPEDVIYRGMSPYESKTCKLMAKESPELAARNADNYKWFVYEMNRGGISIFLKASPQPRRSPQKRNVILAVAIPVAVVLGLLFGRWVVRNRQTAINQLREAPAQDAG